MRTLGLLEVHHSTSPRSLQESAPVLPDSREHGRGRPDGAIVIVSNHPTLVDVTAILSHFDDVCCVVKASLVDSVFVGRLVRTCGHIRAGGEAMSGAALVQEALRRFDVGLAVLIFPESTRSPPGGLHPLRRGAFELAVRAHVPLWPLLLTCNPPALSKGLPFWRQPDRVALLRVQAGDLMTDLSDARSACQTVEALFVEGLRVSSSAIPPTQAPPARHGRTDERTSPRSTTPPAAGVPSDAPSAAPERGRRSNEASHSA